MEGRRDGGEGGGIMREGTEMEGTRVEGEWKAGGGGRREGGELRRGKEATAELGRELTIMEGGQGEGG